MAYGVPRFDARWGGECAACGGEFDPDDRIGYVEDEIACPECCDAEEDARRSPGVLAPSRREIRGARPSQVLVDEIAADEAQAQTPALAAAAYDTTPCKHGISLSGCAICRDAGAAAKAQLADEVSAHKVREGARKARGGWGARFSRPT